jgi:hypothetical protein
MMLYDPKWEQKTKADPFTLESLIAWLKTKPANERYNYAFHDSCMIAQYLTDMGYRNVSVGACGRWDADGASGDLVQFAAIAIARARCTEWTFGAALKRALAEQFEASI